MKEKIITIMNDPRPMCIIGAIRGDARAKKKLQITQN